MSWFSGGSSSGGWFGGNVSSEQRQDDQPLAKMAAKPTAVRDWEQQTIAAERLALAGSHEGPARPKWNPFLSLENSEKFDNKMKNMRQMKDQAPVGDIVLRSFEQQVLGAPLDGPAVPAAGSHGGGENQEVEGVGKGIDGHVIPLMLPWVTWPPQRTRWTPAPDKDDMGQAHLIPDQERRCMGLAYYHQGKTYEYYEVACQIEFARNDELSGHLAGSAGLCFHLRHKSSGVASYLYYVRLGSDETAGDELVLARLEASSYDQYEMLPTEIEVLNKYHRGKFLVNDGVHYFRVRSFSGGFMFYFNHAYVGFYEVKERDKSMATFGHCGIWTYDLEVSVKKMLQKNLEDMEMLDTGETSEELEAGFQGIYAKLKAQHLVVKSSRMVLQDVFMVWCKLLADIREARMAPFRHLEGAEKAHAQKQMLAEWLSTLYTLQRYAELLNSSDHLKGRRLQLFLHELDHTNPPPPPPPLAAPPTPEDEELHYLYEMQQRKYQKQIEDAGRKVLGKEKFAELKNMTTGSLAQQQKDLVAQKQRQMAAESVEESRYQALTKMAQRLLSNFGEMEDLVPTMKSLRGDVSSSST